MEASRCSHSARMVRRRSSLMFTEEPHERTGSSDVVVDAGVGKVEEDFMISVVSDYDDRMEYEE